MILLARLWESKSATAAAELALSLPLLLVIMLGSVELGNYFMDEHRLVKAVRDGARYAARQDLTYFTGCSGSPTGTVVADTQNMVMTRLLSGGDDIVPNVTGATFTVTVACTTTAGGTALGGFYGNVKNSSGTVVGAPIVSVTASIPYKPIFMAYGFSGLDLSLNATQQAAVIGW
jgi:Flp pilus assembly protein TadG